MGVSRRKFLRAGTIASLSAIIPLKSVVSAFGQQPDAGQHGEFKVPLQGQPDERLTEDTFSRYLHSEFRIHTSPLTAITVALVKVKRSEVSTAKTNAKTAKLDSFSVFVRGPTQFVLESNTYRVTHDQMGSFDLFISPVDDGKKEQIYQAVFNRFQS